MPGPLLGVLYHWLGGLASASNFIPFRAIRRWSFEIYWIIQGVAAWLIAPSVIAWIFVPHVSEILSRAPREAVVHAVLYGVAWGFGGLTFGLAVRYLGIALGYAVALGFCTAFGTLIPPMLAGQLSVIASQTGGQIILLGVGVCLLAIAVNGLAGYYKDRDTADETPTSEQQKDLSFGKGIVVAVFAGIMSSFFAFGLAAGKPIGDIAAVELRAQGRLDLWQNLPVLIVVLWGGFATNLAWSTWLILRKRSAGQLSGAVSDPQVGGVNKLTGGQLVKNYLCAASAGIIWYFQFFFYSMGQTKMGKYDFSSWTLHMASIIIFAAIWGVSLKEWKSASPRAKAVLACGVGLLIFSTVIVGYGNYRSAH
ncbi:rhamnose/proton symporter RhaT [Terriglobus albidus]|uniref:Rhamnose/proton symporter RhaT n=1 Tax=Terriglobus albidus TaxID=1592106 RepID=A0A5B9EKJ8_9BACT|nr:L-rhamnose/proton symporter RhaT [Terriglobus albidus]QEE30881.1 rhamnose/proton symporter RhaT [Terriglobus albidus]